MLFRNKRRPLDVVLISVSPPDKHGNCTLGTSVDVARAAVDSAAVVIAQVNKQMPRVLGDGIVHMTELDALVEVDVPLPESPPTPATPEEDAVGRNVAALIEDGSTLQMGIGTIPDAVLAELGGRSDLGVHTEMFTDGLVRLVKSGAINGSRKALFKDRIVASFAMGSQALYDYVDHNPSVEFHPSEIVNDTAVIRQQHAMMAINSAIEIDLTGQVCADSMGETIFSGIGGQMDFVRGAILSPGGKAFIALPSTARGGKLSRIVARLQPGAGVVTTRGHVQWVVTEHGAVNLRGRTLRERADLLISIAHPDFRPELRAAAAARKLFP
jgi:acyl-CoA hydrolase